MAPVSPVHIPHTFVIDLGVNADISLEHQPGASYYYSTIESQGAMPAPVSSPSSNPQDAAPVSPVDEALVSPSSTPQDMVPVSPVHDPHEDVHVQHQLGASYYHSTIESYGAVRELSNIHVNNAAG